MQPTADRLSQKVSENIESIASFHQREQERLSRSERLLDALGALIGRPLYLLSLLAFVAVWIAVNSPAARLGIPVFDVAPFAMLHVVLTIVALATSTLVLINQQRLGRLESQRAHLDLQVNLLTEQKVTEIIHLLEELRRDLPMVHDRTDAEVSELQRPTDAVEVLSALEDVGINASTEPLSKDGRD